jgi:hypothetical protein
MGQRVEVGEGQSFMQSHTNEIGASHFLVGGLEAWSEIIIEQLTESRSRWYIKATRLTHRSSP